MTRAAEALRAREGRLATPRDSEHTASLRSNFAWTLAGNVVYAGCQWAILAVLARLGTPEAVGRFALGLAITAPLFLLFGLQLRGVQATDAARQYRFSEYFGVRVFAMVTALAASTVAAIVPGYDRHTAGVIIAIAFSKAVEGLSDVHYGALHSRERMKTIAISLALRGILSVAAIALVLWAGGGLVSAVLALVASSTIVFLAHDVVAVRALLRGTGESHAPQFGRRATKEIVLLAFPLGLVMMLLSLRTNVPRYVLEHQAGVADLGVFAALASLIVTGNLVVSALGQSASPRLARQFHAGDLRGFRSLLARLLLLGTTIGACAVVVAVVAGRPILHILFGSTYALHSDLLAWLMAAGGVSYCSSFLGYAATAARKFRIQLPLFAASVAATGLASLWLVPRHGLTGGAWAWGIGIAFEFVAMAAVVVNVLREQSLRPAKR